MLFCKLPNQSPSSRKKHLKIVGLFTFCSLLLISHLSAHTSHAEVSSNPDYSVEFEDISTENPEPTKKPPIIKQQSLPIAPSITSQIASPFTITTTNDSLSFGISQTTVDFGALSATNPVIRTSDIYYVNPSRGAKVMNFEDHPLISLDKQVLPDTTCDNGSCSQVIPAIWNSNLTYGFGYRCDSGIKGVCDSTFSSSNSFKQFPDASASEPPQAIILSSRAKSKIESKITYKVNISGTQPVGSYSNTITYIAVPNF